MPNWALELQQFDIERIWIRGEANILADAPSRAPWDDRLAQFLPIPDMPVRDLVVKMYQDPDEVEDLVSRRRKVLTQDKEWEPAPASEPVKVPLLDSVQDWGYETPGFGKAPGTPDFGEESAIAREVIKTFGEGRVLYQSGGTWPRFPVCVC